MSAIELKTGKQYWKRIAVLWGMMGFLGLVIEAMAKTAGRTASSAVTREIVRGVLGSLLGGGSRRR